MHLIKNPSGLNGQQLDMIRLFKRPMPEDDFFSNKKAGSTLIR